MEMHERLVAARKHAGYATAAEAAEAIGVRYPTYAGHENGSSPFPARKGDLYARRFKVRFEWLMTGKGEMVDLPTKYREMLELFDSLPAEAQATYLTALRNLAELYPVNAHAPRDEGEETKATR